MSYIFLLVGYALLAAPEPLVTEAEIAPISLGTGDVKARALMARGRWGDAARHVTSTRSEARLVRGWLLQKAGDAAGAVAALEGLEGRLPLLARLARLVRAKALMAQDRFEEAAATATMPADDAIGRQARRLRARALREGGQLPRAREVYREMLGSGLKDEIAVGLLGLARLERDDGHPERALPLLRRLDVESPAHWAAAKGRREAAALVLREPSLVARWAVRHPEERVARAERLLKRHRNKAVVEALASLTREKLETGLACRHRYTLGRALRKLRRWKEARPRLEEAVAFCREAKSDLEPWARHLAGKAAERLSFEKEAAKHYRTQMKRHAEHRLADDAGYQLVRHLVEDKGDLKGAHDAAVGLAKHWPNGDLVPDALFFVAAHAIHLKKPKLARRMLDLEGRLPTRDFNHRDGGRQLYWMARLDHQAGRREAATTGYRKVLSEARLGWYSILAYSRLYEIDRRLARGAAREALGETPEGVEGRPALPSAEGTEWRLPLPTGLAPEAWARALLLARVGLARPAWSALKEAGAAGGGEGLLWLSALILDRAGAWNLSHDILRRRLPEFRRYAPVGSYRKHWKLAYPRPFAGLARKYARASGLDRHFPHAVMREESGFNTGIESFANAVGLMQLILPTAKQMAKKADGKVSRRRLTEPDLNVRLGCRYLAHVRDVARAVTPLLPAGYNAGAGALRRWLNARGSLPLDLFVELIPYDEARGYTKRVVASWATYRVLYGKGLKDPLPYISQKTRTPKAVKKKKGKKKRGKRKRRSTKRSKR